MYDKIDLYITCRALIGKLEENDYEFMRNSRHFVRSGSNGTKTNKFKLWNGKSGANSHSLTIEIVRRTRGDNISPPVMHISGSLRKWFYGALSMNDLTKFDTMLALMRLADRLEIPYEEFRDYPVSSFEVGLNLDLGDIKCEEVTSRVCSFKNGSYECTDAKGYKRFKASKFSGKMYNKVGETRKAIKKMEDRWGAEDFEREHGNSNKTRVEFKVVGGAKQAEKFFGVRTVADLVYNYNKVAAYWVEYIRMFDFKGVNIVPFQPKYSSTKEVMDYLKYRGLVEIGEVEMESMLSLLTPQAKSDARKALRKLREGMPETMKTRTFFIYIANLHFVEQIRKSQRQWIDEKGSDLLLTLL